MAQNSGARTRSGLAYLLLAKLVAFGHTAFSVFALFGGLLVARFGWVFWPHMVAFAWAFGTLAFDWGCPVTPFEKSLLERAGAPVYQEGFVQHYLTRTALSEDRARQLHVLLAIALGLANLLIYHFVVGAI